MQSWYLLQKNQLFFLVQCPEEHTCKLRVSKEDKFTDDHELWPLPFQDIRAKTAPKWGYCKHGRRLDLHHVGQGDALFLSKQLTKLKGQSRPKIQTHGSCCTGAKMSTTRGNVLFHLWWERITGGRKYLTQYCNTFSHLHSVQTNCTLFHIFFFFSSLRPACGCCLHRFNPSVS